MPDTLSRQAPVRLQAEGPAPGCRAGDSDPEPPTSDSRRASAAAAGGPFAPLGREPDRQPGGGEDSVTLTLRLPATRAGARPARGGPGVAGGAEISFGSFESRGPVTNLNV